MVLEKIIVGLLGTNCYLVGSDKSRRVFIIDPGDEPELYHPFGKFSIFHNKSICKEFQTICKNPHYVLI